MRTFAARAPAPSARTPTGTIDESFTSGVNSASAHVLMKAQLVLQISIELIPPEEEQQTSEQRTHVPLLTLKPERY